MSAPTRFAAYAMFNGRHERYRHFSATTQCEMTFAVYLPPQAEAARPAPPTPPMPATTRATWPGWLRLHSATGVPSSGCT